MSPCCGAQDSHWMEYHRAIGLQWFSSYHQTIPKWISNQGWQDSTLQEVGWSIKGTFYSTPVHVDT